jgi:hypothetical protein
MTAVAPSGHEPGEARPVVPAAVRSRSWISIRWREFRNAPRPIVRAVASSMTVAVVLGVAYLVYDLAIARGVDLPGGDLRVAFVVAYVLVVLGVGSIATYLIVPLPRGAGAASIRTPWSAALGFFAAVPIAYLVLVVVSQIVRPLLG